MTLREVIKDQSDWATTPPDDCLGYEDAASFPKVIQLGPLRLEEEEESKAAPCLIVEKYREDQLREDWRPHQLDAKREP
jgi:hypothetical protein